MSRRGVLAALVLVMLPGAGCLATKPYVRTEVQQSEARTQEQLQTVERRLDTMERDLGEERARLVSLDADVREIRGVAENAAKQGDRTRDLAVKADGAARDALQAVNRSPAPKAPESVAATPETFVVHFGFAEWWLDNSGRMTLNKALKRLEQNPALVARLEGYADNLGSPSLNLKLSHRRAAEVWRFLVGKGVTRNRIETLAIGEARPVASNRGPTGREQNRRVAITLLTPAP